MTTRMFRSGFAVLLLCGAFVVGLWAAAGTAQAQRQAPNRSAMACGDHADIAGALARLHGESRRGIGVVSRSAVAELYVSGAGSWTVLITNPMGRACIVAAGKYWNDVAPEATGPES